MFTSTHSAHVKEVVTSSREGGASLNILSGLVAGNFSGYWLGLTIMFLMTVAYLVSSLDLTSTMINGEVMMVAPAIFAFGLVAFGFLGMGPVTIAVDSYGPVTDNAQSVFELSQIEHLMQCSEAIRAEGHPRWMILTGLVHDLGKILCLFGEPQWAVVGDTFPVGCAYSEAIVFPEFFAENPDSNVPEYQTSTGIYTEKCGLDNVHLSWGHDEYLYHVVKDYLPPEALAMIRYHSCYPIHHEGAYSHLLNDADHRLLDQVRAFNPYDLYSKGHGRPDVEGLKPYYLDLIAEFFPPTLGW